MSRRCELPKLTEKQFQAQILKLARICGWMAYHTFDSRRSTAGFPDLVLVHPRRGRVLVAELKSATGTVKLAQAAWLEAFKAAGITARSWRPADWPEIQETLS